MTDVKWRRKVLAPDEIQHLVLDYNQGMPLKDMQEKYGVSRATIYNILNRQLEKAGNE